MKNLILFIGALLIAGSSLAQTPAVDKLFDKYAYKDGFTTVLISKHMFELFAEKNMADKESEAMREAISGLESIRILTVEDSALNSRINFFSEIGQEIPFSEYETLLTVKESNQQMRMMIKEKNGQISEFLMLSGGSDNVLISIVGIIDLESIAKISGAIDMEKLQELEKLEK
ncbi:MAG: DUF4252 domain-containing protein [Bacteroidales bacterium]|nr:DUF4252 domain-containing protein [Bacteroidales bacterium]